MINTDLNHFWDENDKNDDFQHSIRHGQHKRISIKLIKDIWDRHFTMVIIIYSVIQVVLNISPTLNLLSWFLLC